MSQLHSHGVSHRCQIDCTNHDEVITALELKSKDLYYFWRNYEWLYNRYYALLNAPKEEPIKVTESHKHCKEDLESLQNQNEHLITENRRLKLEIETYKKQLSHSSSKDLEQQYKKEITIWKNKASQYEQINEKLIAENNKLKNSIKANYDEFQSEKERLTREHRKAKQTIVELQETLDDMRRAAPTARPLQPIPRTDIEEFSRKQTDLVTTSIRYASGEAERIVATELDGLKVELQERLAEMLSCLSQRQLQSIIVSIQE